MAEILVNGVPAKAAGTDENYQKDDTLEGLLKDLEGYIEGDHHERIMNAFYQQNCKKYEGS
jgi:hypothetical protein